MVEGEGRLEKGVRLDARKRKVSMLTRAERGEESGASYGGCEMESVFNGVRKGSGDEAVLSAAYFLGLGFSYGVRSNFLFAPVFFLGVSNLFCTHSRNPSALNPLDSRPSKHLLFLCSIFFSPFPFLPPYFNHIPPISISIL